MGLSRKIKCKHCSFTGVIEAHDTMNYPTDKIFKHLGKDARGYLHFLCPACTADEGYSPYTFINPLFEFGFLIVIGLMIYILFKLIT